MASTRLNTKPESVVTGQQIGLLGGPLFSVYKLIGALHQAQTHHLKAIYWLETHDADFSEANTLSFIDKTGTPKRLVWKRKTIGTPIGDILIDNELCSMLRYAFKEFPASPYLATTEKMLLKIFREKRPLGAATEELFSHWFKKFPIHFFNPNQKDFHEFSKPMLLREAAQTPLDKQCNLFALIEGVRTSLFRTSHHQFTTRTGKPVLLHQHILLPNLTTRSVIQDAYLRTKFYIAGPSEALYLKNLNAAYTFHQITPAKIQNRMSLTWLTPNQMLRLQTLNFTPEVILHTPYPKLLHTLIYNRTGKDLSAKRQHLGNIKKELLSTLQHSYSSTHSHFKYHLKQTEHALYKEFKHFLGMMRHDAKQTVHKEAHTLRTLVHHLKPFNKKQERTLNWLPIVAQYGETFLDTLYKNHRFEETTLTLPID